MSDYLRDGVLIYLRDDAADGLVDWDTHFRFLKGDGVDVEAERETLRAVLDAAAEICESIEEDARAGWDEAAVLEAGEVRHPAHIAKAYELLREAGIVSFGVEEAYEGVELPSLVATVVLQMISRADAGLMTIVGLQAGVAEDIQKYASEELKAAYLPRFARGEVQGAMDLTEPQAGSDLGAITTRATEEDGKIYLDGQKIFITNGGAEIHLVLARDDDTFEQSKGTTQGLSLFLCPRTLPDGTKNHVTVERLEEKLGIHGSPTCAIRFDRAEAFRIAEKGAGFRAMLDLMNNARLGVAAQGVGISEAAISEAVRYARERKQFGVPIADHALMKNMLARMILAAEGSRALLYRCCVLVDRNRAITAKLARDADLSEPERVELEKTLERNQTRIRLLTPLAKYLATEACDRISREAIQVHGGLGFMSESTVAKLHQDAIITTIYEGTSEIQASFALKEMSKGALLVVFEELRNELDTMTDEPLDEYASKVRGGVEKILQASPALLSDFNYALLSSKILSEAVAFVIVATELLKQARVDPRRIDLAASWIDQRMPEVEMHARRIAEGSVSRIERCERILELEG